MLEHRRSSFISILSVSRYMGGAWRADVRRAEWGLGMIWDSFVMVWWNRGMEDENGYIYE